MSTIQAEAIRVAYEDRVIIDSLSTAIPKEKITTIIGSNGCGKSTLLKALTRIPSSPSWSCLSGWAGYCPAPNQGSG